MSIFIYGSYTTIIDSSRPNGIICSNCKAINQIVVEKRAYVIHLMYVPIIPIRTRNIFICKSCCNDFDLRELNIESKTYFKQFKSKKRIPIWLFSGPILILITIGFISYNRIDEENEMLRRLENGNQTRIIEYQTDEGNFSVLKTLKITSDSV